MFYVYVLRSRATGKLYKGMCTDLDVRIREHNAKKTKSTKSGVPWELVYYEEFETSELARSREKYFKTAAGRRYIKLKLQ